MSQDTFDSPWELRGGKRARALAEELRARRVDYVKDMTSRKKRKDRASNWNHAEANSVTHGGRQSETGHHMLPKDASPNRVTHLDSQNERGLGNDKPILLVQSHVG